MYIFQYVYTDEHKHKVGSKVIAGEHYQSDSEKALSLSAVVDTVLFFFCSIAD